MQRRRQRGGASSVGVTPAMLTKSDDRLPLDSRIHDPSATTLVPSTHCSQTRFRQIGWGAATPPPTMDIQQLCAALQGALSPEQHQRKAAEGLLEQVGPSDPWRHAARCASDAHASPPLGASSERNVSPGTEGRGQSSRQRACLPL